MAERVTIKDVAKHCGLSKSTVAYILSNSPHYKASEKARRLVEKAMKELNYKPNIAASSLRTNKTYTIGIIIRSLYDRFYAELAEHLQHQLALRQYTGVFTFSRDGNYDAVVGNLVSKGVDACINTVAGALPLLLENKLPVVHYTSRTGYDIDHIAIDHRKIVHDSVNLLYELGHRKIGFAGQKKEGTPKYDALIEALNKFGLPYDDRRAMHCVHTYEQGAEYCDHICSLPEGIRPTAVITQNDPIAMGFISKAVQLGMRVPSDISVIGSNNIVESRYFIPRLTTFNFPVESIAEKIVELLFRRMDNPECERVFSSIEASFVPGASVATVKNDSFA